MKKILMAISATFLVTSMATAGVPSKPTVSKQSASNDVVEAHVKPGVRKGSQGPTCGTPFFCPPR